MTSDTYRVTIWLPSGPLELTSRTELRPDFFMGTGSPTPQPSSSINRAKKKMIKEKCRES